MNKMMYSEYNLNSSGLSMFENQSTADSRFSQIVPMTELIEAPESGKYSVFEVANWFLTKEAMTHKKLQKLCYYAQAWCYALKGYRLMDTVFEAWVHGPVSPVLYDKFKCFRFNSIKLVGEVHSSH